MSQEQPEFRHVLFVYGSLKSGEENHRFLANQQFAGEARTAGNYRMYELDGYPGMVQDGTVADFITGELWRVTDECLAELDDFEGVDVGLYRREPVTLAAPNESVVAETYVYARPVSGRKLLGHTWKRAR